jgi:hypothetical protein
MSGPDKDKEPVDDMVEVARDTWQNDGSEGPCLTREDIEEDLDWFEKHSDDDLKD